MQSSTMNSKNMTQEERNQAFYEWLPEKDKLIHTLARQMLKTRYDPKRSNAYQVWKKTLDKGSDTK